MGDIEISTQVAARHGQKPTGRRRGTTNGIANTGQSRRLQVPRATTGMPSTGSVTRHRTLETPPAPPLYFRCADDFCVLVGDGGWRRAYEVRSEMEELLAECQLSSSPTKTYIGAVTDSFDFLGLNLRIDRDSGTVIVEPNRAKVYGFQRRIDHVIRQNVNGNRGEAKRVLEAVGIAVSNRLGYFVGVGADLDELREFTLRRLLRWSGRRGWGLDVDVVPWCRVQWRR
jgi:hypothetical protein